MNKNVAVFSYMAYLKLPDNPIPTLYLVGLNKVLYFKNDGQELKKSIRQHPAGLAWTKARLMSSLD